MRQLRAGVVTVAFLLVPTIAEAQTRWIHVRSHEVEGSRARVAINLPLRSAIALTRAMSSAEGEIEIGSANLDIDAIASGWRTLREREPGTQVSSREHHGDLTFLRSESGMTITSKSRWNGEISEVVMIAPLLDLLSAGDLAEHALQSALRQLPSGVPALTARGPEGTLIAWVDEWPEGALP